MTTPFSDGAADLALQPDGKIITVGSVSIPTSGGRYSGFALLRFNANGSLDRYFGHNGHVGTSFGGDAYGRSVLLQPDGKIIAAGSTLGDCSKDPPFLCDGTFALARYFGGSAHCVVPRLVGEQFTRAKRSLRRAYCTPGRVRKEFSSVQPGRVLSQRPRAHTVHAAGTKVNLVVSKGGRR